MDIESLRRTARLTELDIDYLNEIQRILRKEQGIAEPTTGDVTQFIQKRLEDGILTNWTETWLQQLLNKLM
jgi:hypothetical protein